MPEMTNVRDGKSPASQAPSKMRQAMTWLYVCKKPVPIVMALQQTMATARTRPGPNLRTAMTHGVSKMT